MKYKLLLMILATLVYLPKGYAKTFPDKISTEIFFSEDRNVFVRIDTLISQTPLKPLPPLLTI